MRLRRLLLLLFPAISVLAMTVATPAYALQGQEDEQPVDEQPVDEQPVDEQPVDEQPVDEQPVD
ncbi:MAG: hypothetical protein P8J01_10650, partial [Acidimicrobiales bacterium]|nr:hypothetical protein [Acidimicrobiales bacterium]